jgi:flavin-dependent dehydrogenase
MCNRNPLHPTHVRVHSEVVAWLGSKAQELGAEVLPGFPARSLLLDGGSVVAGVTTAEQGVSKTCAALSLSTSLCRQRDCSRV